MIVSSVFLILLIAYQGSAAESNKIDHHEGPGPMVRSDSDYPVPNEKCPAYDDPEHPKHLPHSDCTKFYKCSNGLAYTMKCPVGQHWSVKLDRCDWPSVAQCQPSYSTTTTTTTTDPSTTTAKIETTTPEASTSEDITTENTPSPPVTEVCKSIDNTTLLPHPSDCTKYIQCEFGKGHIRQCPAGLHFSVLYNLCQWPEIAKCNIAK